MTTYKLPLRSGCFPQWAVQWADGSAIKSAMTSSRTSKQKWFLRPGGTHFTPVWSSNLKNSQPNTTGRPHCRQTTTPIPSKHHKRATGH